MVKFNGKGRPNYAIRPVITIVSQYIQYAATNTPINHLVSRYMCHSIQQNAIYRNLKSISFEIFDFFVARFFSNNYLSLACECEVIWRVYDRVGQKTTRKPTITSTLLLSL